MKKLLIPRFKTLLTGIVMFLISYSMHAQIRFDAGDLELSLSAEGRVLSFKNTKENREFISKDTASYFISLQSGGKTRKPVIALRIPNSDLILFRFENSPVDVEVLCAKRKNHLTFTILKAEPENLVEGLSWGPIYTTINEKIGEVVGVVRNTDVSLGMLVLNAKTLGGFYNKNGLNEDRGSLALPWKNGSSMQAYAMNRNRFRQVETMGHANIPVKPMIGETVFGSSIALFSCSEPKTLDIIEQVVLEEKLPHPTCKGIWTKKAFLPSRSYLISDFKESEIDEIIGYAKRGGFFSLYHEGPFKSWGHYPLDTSWFPSGITGMKRCAEKAKEAGLNFGVHTLTNFISTDDPYVTPVPDKRLAITGYGLLSKNIDSQMSVIPISTIEFFNDNQNNNLHTVRIGDELITYKSVNTSQPYILLECQRGAFGTQAASHTENDTVKKLIDHAYKVFFPDIQLQREIAVNLAKFFNAAGISHLDFDGHEGCFASGEGDYASVLFAEDFYKTLDHEFVNGTSRSKPYYWYINTLCNWGEPWYGGFKESMQEYRISNQAMLERNYFPNMLGWYMLTKTTTMAEMEWMLARSAGWNAGFAMVTRLNAIRENVSGPALLDAIRIWEEARLTGVFTPEQKELLKDPKREFHLEKVGENEWKLSELTETRY
jgi:hypothetical protein